MKKLLLKLFVKFIYSREELLKIFLPKHKFFVHDILASGMALDVRYRVEARYYNYKLEPVLIVMDQNGKMCSLEEAGLVRADQAEDLVETV